MKKSIKNPIFILVLVFVLAFGISCGGGGSSITTGGTTETGTTVVGGTDGYITGSDDSDTSGDTDVTIVTTPEDAEDTTVYNISLSNLTGHNVYAVASNQLITTSRTSKVQFYGGTEANSLSKSASTSTTATNAKEIISFTPEFTPLSEEEINNISKSAVSSSSMISASYSEGDSRDFTVYKYGTTATSITAVLRKRAVLVSGKGVNVWVDSAIWTGSSAQETMVDTVADNFLWDGNNDIYTWVTDIFGDEYYQTTHSKASLVQGGDINIVLFNINGNSPGSSRILGYFNGEDVYYTTYYSNSNEMNGFYVDFYSLMDSDDFWSDMAYSTVAHEFLHSVVFYQKYLLRGELPDTWLNEMLAMVTEDILSNKLGLKGPRGVTALDGSGSNITDGRLAYANNTALNRVGYSNGETINYNTIYAFGAYLLRNYGLDLTLFSKIVQSSEDGFDAIENGLSQLGYDDVSYELILNNAKAMILSQGAFTANEKYKYNGGTSGFTASLGSDTFSIGSINLYNYYYEPYTYGVGDTPEALNRASSLLFKLAENKTGAFNVNLSLPNYTKVEIIVTDTSGNYDITKSGQVQVETVE